MKNQFSPVSFKLKSGLRLGLLGLLSAFTALANELKDVTLSGGKSPSVKFIFVKGKSAEDYPLYFQKIDGPTQTVTVCFLETPSSLPLGKLTLPEKAPVRGIALKKVTTPSGKNFLGVEIAFAEAPNGELALLPSGGASLRAQLPMATGGKLGKFAWSAQKSLSAPPPAPPANAPEETPVKVAQVDAAPQEPQAAAPTPAPAAEPKAAPMTEPAPAVAEMAAPPPAETSPIPQAKPAEPGKLVDIAVVVGPTQQDLILEGEGFGGISFQRNSQDTLAYELRVALARIGSLGKSFTPPAASIFGSIKLKQIKDTALVSLRLRKPAMAQAGMAGKQVAVTIAQGGETQIKWLASSAKTVAATGMPESGPSAHDEGSRIDQGKRELSSSLVFLPGGFGKPMLIMKDSAALREKPQPKAKAIKHVPAGAQILRLDTEGLYVKVVSDGDTGYIAKNDALYADELTEKDEAKLQRLLTAREKAMQKALEKAALAAKAEQETQEAAVAAEAKALADAQAAQAAQVAQAEKAAQAAQAAQQQQTPQVEQGSPSPQAAQVQQTEPAAPATQATAKAEGSTPPLHIATQDEQKLGQAPDAAMLQRLEQEKLAAEKDKQKAAEGPIVYNSFGRRDPFVPVEQGNSDNGIDIDQMKVVGIVWHLSDPLAVLQHVTEPSVSFTVKQGDPVHNGRVSRITRDAVTFDITEYGISRSYSLKLVSLQERAKK